MNLPHPVLLVDLLVLKKIAFIFFAGMFLVILVRLILAPRDRYQKQAQIPLSDDQIVEPREEEKAHG